MQKHLAEALEQFDRIVELPLADRALALAALDPAVAAAVSELLRADAASTGVLDQGVQAFATQLVDTEADDAAHVGTLKSGDVVGAFVLQRMLGRGGMGEVWLAERQDAAQANHFCRVAHRETSFVQQVALKVLKRGMDSDALSARFVQERKILAELNHPHFARFIDGGVSLDGRLYFAMEYVDGVNLMEHASAKNLSVRERVRLLAEVSEAVAYAQNHLVVHRDLKPSNILVDASGAVRVLDFGIAKLLGERAPTDTLTHTGVHVLSPAYAAPEQVLGLAISTGTDVYALGVILFELVTGTLPNSRRLVSYEALMAQVKEEQTPVPSRALRGTANTGGSGSLNNARAAREVAGDLDTIILTALQREPTRRYATAAALADDLRRWLDARPIAAQPDSRGYRVKKFVARNRVMVGSASTVLLALIAGLAVAIWQAGIAREQAARAEESYRQAQRVNAFFSMRIIEGNVTKQAAGAGLTFKDWLIASVPRLDTDLADAPSGRANLRREFSLSLRELGELDAAVEQGDVAIAEAREIFGNSLELGLALQAQGGNLSEKGEFDRAQQSLEDSLAIYDALPPSEDVSLNRVMARTTLLRIANARGDYAGALAIALLNIAERGALYGVDDYRLAVDYHNLSAIYARLGHLTEAEQANVRARGLLEKDPSRPQARMAFLDQGLCSLRILHGASAAAVEICKRAIALSTQVVGAEHPQTLAQRSTLAAAWVNAGAIDEAAREIATLLARARAQNLRELDDVLTIAARIEMHRQRWPEALQLAQEAADLHDTRHVEAGVFFDRARLLRALAQHALDPTAASLAALDALAQPVIANQSSAALIRAFAAWCVYQGLLLSHKDTAAQSMAETALGLLRKDMDQATAERQWANWSGAGAAPSQ